MQASMRETVTEPRNTRDTICFRYTVHTKAAYGQCTLHTAHCTLQYTHTETAETQHIHTHQPKAATGKRQRPHAVTDINSETVATVWCMCVLCRKCAPHTHDCGAQNVDCEGTTTFPRTDLFWAKTFWPSSTSTDAAPPSYFCPVFPAHECAVAVPAPGPLPGKNPITTPALRCL